MPVAVNGRKLMNTPFGMSNLDNLKVHLRMSKLENLEEENQNLIPQEVNKLINKPYARHYNPRFVKPF